MASIVCGAAVRRIKGSGVGASVHLNDLVTSTTSLQMLSVLLCRGTPLLLHSNGSHHLALLCPVGIRDKLSLRSSRGRSDRQSTISRGHNMRLGSGFLSL